MMHKTNTIFIFTVAMAISILYTISAVQTNYQISDQSIQYASAQEKPQVIVSFFPLYDFAKNIAGDKAGVSLLIPAGVEPHDWEPSPQDIENIQNADMVIYNGAGFEKWIEEVDSEFIVDTSKNIDLIENDKGIDPHIWLDPILVIKQVESIRDGFIQIDPGNAEYYKQNAANYINKLESLDSFIKTELSFCLKKDFIAFHNAFGYFANKYGLTQYSVYEELSPQGDIKPQRIAEIKDLAAQLGINVIYSEDLVDPRLVNVIAQEIEDGKVLVLSPIEGLDRDEIESNLGYMDKMRENVENLKEGLECI